VAPRLAVMASDAQPKKSKWGVSALLQQAVSGVESRLDVILANEDELPTKTTPQKPTNRDERSSSTSSPVKPAINCTLLTDLPRSNPLSLTI
jgi:hypothetical protein